jgi:hypothetical protein
MVSDDAELIATALTLTPLEILAAKMWRHVKGRVNMYDLIYKITYLIQCKMLLLLQCKITYYKMNNINRYNMITY